jgi:hypothetical protein
MRFSKNGGAETPLQKLEQVSWNFAFDRLPSLNTPPAQSPTEQVGQEKIILSLRVAVKNFVLGSHDRAARTTAPEPTTIMVM